MTEELTIKIHWKGPYFKEDITELDVGKNWGAYLLTGKQKFKQVNQQYIGITEQSYKIRFSDPTHPINFIVRDLEIWLGEIIYPHIDNYTRKHLESAEKILIYYWQPELNNKCTRYAPESSITVVSHWFKKNGEPRKNQVYSDLPDVISWDCEYWRVGNLKLYREE
jgi:hypothetical protein